MNRANSNKTALRADKPITVSTGIAIIPGVHGSLMDRIRGIGATGYSQPHALECGADNVIVHSTPRVTVSPLNLATGTGTMGTFTMATATISGESESPASKSGGSSNHGNSRPAAAKCLVR